MSDGQLSTGFGALVALFAFIGVSAFLGFAAERVVERGEFLKGYFLGNRSLGAWALALTATVQSGGTFMGFPSLVYSHGWILTLWIAGYMMVPLMAFGIIGKRVAQLSRQTGAITLPDVLRERFASPTVGLISSLLIMTFMTFMLVAQFKAGALVMKVAWPDSGFLAFAEDGDSSGTVYYVGLVLFAGIVVGYTLFGGFLAAVWTDLFQSVMMLVGVVILLLLAVPAAGGLEQATRSAVEATGPGFASGPGYAADGRQFLPLGLAFSFFLIYPVTSTASPASVVRVMACRNTPTIRRSIVVLSIYNALIYVPLIVICICARAIMPDLKHTDEVVPRMALLMTSQLSGGSWIAGLILAAPFGAVMATVSSYLVVIASGLVRDIYQRLLRPDATQREVRLLTYGLMILVGCIAIGANIRPVQYLQAIVVFSSSSAAASFLVPLVMAAYWRRATAAGIIAAMIAGSCTMFGLFLVGWTAPDPMIGQATSFRPYFLFGLEPIVWGLLASLIAGVLVSKLTQPPEKALVERLLPADHGVRG